MVARHELHFFGGAQEDRDALVDLFGDDVQNRLTARRGGAARVFDQHRHRVGFVHEAQLPGLREVAVVARVHEDAAALKDAVDFRHHGGDPAHVEVLAAHAGLAFEQFGDVALHRGFPMTHVRAVDRELLRGAFDADVFAREDEGARRRVEREHDDAAPEREDELGLGAVHAVAGGDLVAAGLQEVGFNAVALRTHAGEHREDRADRDVDVDVRRAVERIEGDQVRAHGAVFRNAHHGFDFFAQHAADRARARDRLDEDVVADHVELLLVFALNVRGAGGTQNARERAVAHLEADRLAGFRNARQKTGEHRVEAVEGLFAGEILVQREGHLSVSL